MTHQRQRVRDRENWPEGTIAAFDRGIPLLLVNGVWRDGTPDGHIINVPAGAWVLRVGNYAS